jgi:hypothetical protein
LNDHIGVKTWETNGKTFIINGSVFFLQAIKAAYVIFFYLFVFHIDALTSFEGF